MPTTSVRWVIRREPSRNRACCTTSQLTYLGALPAIETIVALLRSGIDVTIPQDENSSIVLNCVLDLVQNYEPDKYRVLVVEDSRVAVALIQRTVAEWEAKDASSRIELAVGRDLQFIRINGTVVGALAGLVIHAGTVLLG